MDQHFPQTKITRGCLSGQSNLLLAILLNYLAAVQFLDWLRFGSAASGVLAGLLFVASLPFMQRWRHYHTGACRLIFCNENHMLIMNRSRPALYLKQEDAKRIARDDFGYTLVPKAGENIRIRHKDVAPEHAGPLRVWHERLEAADRSDPAASPPPSA